MDKVWKIGGKFSGDIISSLLAVRNIKNVDEFLNPKHPSEILNELDADIKPAIELIKKHIAKNSHIFIYGDYDVDGICATAILYKTIHDYLGYENCSTFIPDRMDEGYGLSRKSIDALRSLLARGDSSIEESPALIITVDCGVTAVEECEYIKSLGFDLIISDHHEKPKTLPNPDVLVWTDKLVGAGIALLISQVLYKITDYTLSLSALATVCDLQPLFSYNRSIVKYGLSVLNENPPVGIKALVRVSGITGKKITTYELGWVFGPRLNASGRLNSAEYSLKLLLCQKENEAIGLAEILNKINYERQQKTFSSFEYAKSYIKTDKKLLIIKSTEFHEGVIGLVAGRLVSQFYKPSIVISEGEVVSKGSARSVEGVDIVELLRASGKFLEKVGGHKMAAGFSIKNSNLENFIEKLYEVSENKILEENLNRVLNIDLELTLEEITSENYLKIKELEPFGNGNSEPVLAVRKVKIVSMAVIGSKKEHLKLKISDNSGNKFFDCVYFGGASKIEGLKVGDFIDLAFSLNENFYNGYTSLDLHVKDALSSP